MAYKTWVSGELLTSSDVNGYLMKQAVIVCTSATRPSSPPEGMLIYETDTDRYSSYNGTSWVTLGQTVIGSYTPLLTGATTNPALGTGGQAVGRYTLFNGKMCTYWGMLTFGTASVSAGSGQYYISLPFNSSSASSILNCGASIMRDASANSIQSGSSYMGSGVATLSLISGAGNIVSSATPWTWAASDYMTWNITYEIA